MRFSPMLVFHICSGTVGVISGFIAVALRKGSKWHGKVGNVFFVAMLGLGLSGAYMGLMKSQVTNVLAGTLTCYLVSTSWLTARRREGTPGIFDWVALLFILVVGAAEIVFGIQAIQSPTGMKYGYPFWPYAIFGLVALLAAAGDIRMLMRRGISGTQRVARHLWRMCFAFFIGSASIFLARPHLFPVFMRKTYMLPLLGFLPLLLMIFWLIRVRLTKAYKQKPIPRSAGVSSLPA